MIRTLFLQALLLVTLAVPALAAPQIGEAAPDFTLTDSQDKPHSLSEYKGKAVVLEWTNPQCPYVKKHYGSGSMQKLQKDATDAGVIWLSINSSAPGKEGYTDAKGTQAVIAEQKSAETARLIDADGTVGKLYGAKTTPHMFVVDKEGRLVYMGAIDDAPSTEPSSLTGAKNYVTAALDALKEGKPVAMPVTQPYGCGVKYKE